MRGFLGGLLILGSIYSQPALSAKMGEDSALLFVKKLVNANNWYEYLHPLQDELPAIQWKEMDALANNAFFPDKRIQKSNLLILDPNGGRIKIDFGSHGRVFFNDEEWETHPLETTQSEVLRIVAFLQKGPRRHASLFDFLFPLAQATTDYPTGDALAAQAAATGWKAENCTKPPLSADQEKTCSLMTVAMTSEMPKEEDIYPIRLNCPIKGTGWLDRLSEDIHGNMQLAQVYYQENKPVKAVVKIFNVSDKPPGFKKIIEITKGQEQGGDEKKYFQTVASSQSNLKKEVCDASAEKIARFKSGLGGNRTRLPSTADLPPTPGSESIEAL